MDEEDIGVVGTPGSAKAPHSKLSPPEAVASALIGAILTAIVLLLVERMLGGGWRTLWSFFSTWILLALGLVPILVMDDEPKPGQRYAILGIGAGYGAILGLVHGIVFCSLLPGVFFGACIGNFVGLLFLLRGKQATSMPSAAGLRVGVVVAGGILASHLLGIMKPTTLSQPKPILGQQAEAPDDPPNVPFKPFKTADEMRALLIDAANLALAMPRSEVISLLGPPTGVVPRGAFEECTWAMERDPGDYKCRVTVTFENGFVCSFDRNTGRLLLDDEMNDLYRTTQQLSRRISPQALPPSMGEPSSIFIQALPKAVGPVDPITHEIKMGTQTMEVREWYRAGDPAQSRVTLAFMDRALFRAECCEGTRGVFFSVSDK